MKKISKCICYCIALAGLVLTSCNDMLETKNFTDMTPSNFFKTESDIDASILGLYLPCTTNWGFTDKGVGYYQTGLFCADIKSTYTSAMVTTDIIKTYSSNPYEEFIVGPSTVVSGKQGGILDTYNLMRFVARATDIINQINNCSAGTKNVRNRYIAEAKTLRAYYMYTLLDWFGPVNVKLDPVTLMDNTVEPRPDELTYVKYILQDLEDAINTQAFPNKYNDDAGNWGRMSKAIAYAVRMKTYMHQKDWANAKADALELMNMGFEIISNYEDVFNLDRTAEHIWSVPSNTASDNYYITELLPADFKRGYNHENWSYIRGTENDYQPGWQIFCMRWDFYDTFEDCDKRKATILCKYDTNEGKTKDRNSGMVGALPLKYTDTQFKHAGIQKAFPVIRYAEVLLSYAEAENELNGPTQNAQNAIQPILTRANVTIPATAIANKEAFRDYLLEERGRELHCEGQRRQDLIRHGVYIERAKKRGNDAQDYQVLFPIPQKVIIEANGIIEQNPGYTN